MLPEPLQTRVGCLFLLHAPQMPDSNDAGMTCAGGMRTPIPSWAGTPPLPASLLVTSYLIENLVSVLSERNVLLNTRGGFKTFILGAVRVFEFRKKAGAPNFIRFPLFPGEFSQKKSDTILAIVIK